MSDAIKNVEDIEKIKECLKINNKRNYLLFVIGINTGIKSNNIIKLRLKDLCNEKKECKNYIEIENIIYPINKSIKQAMEEFLKENTFELNSYLFVGKGSENPINRSHLYRILNKVVQECNIDIKIGNETLRKTFGYHYYLKTKDVKYLKHLFKKNSKQALFEYLGIKDERTYNEEFFL